MAGLSPLATTALVAGGLFMVARSRANKRRAQAAASTPSGPTKVLEVLYGPEADPCLGDAYSRTAQPMLPEALENFSPDARALYGDRAVYFIRPDLLGPTLISIAQIRVNEHGVVEPVIKVARELAPGCQWLAPEDEWSSAMVAFRDSLERMVQVIDTDIASAGNLPGLYRPHAWQNYPVVRDGKWLNVKSGTTIAFELPPGDPTQFAISAQVASGDPSAKLEHLGIVESFGLADGEGGYFPRPVILLRPEITGAPATFTIAAATPDGAYTRGSLDAYA